jgi:hypothetical protein
VQLELASTLDSHGIGAVFEPTTGGQVGPGRTSSGTDFYHHEKRSSKSNPLPHRGSDMSEPASAPPPYDQILATSDPAAIARATPVDDDRPDDAAAAAADTHSAAPPLTHLGSQTLGDGLRFGEDGFLTLQEFVSRPTPEGLTVQCEISRSKSRKSTYILKLERPEMGGVQKVFLLAGKKRNRAGAKSNFLISCDPNDMKKESDAYIAKVCVRINFILCAVDLCCERTRTPTLSVIIRLCCCGSWFRSRPIC